MNPYVIAGMGLANMWASREKAKRQRNVDATMAKNAWLIPPQQYEVSGSPLMAGVQGGVSGYNLMQNIGAADQNKEYQKAQMDWLKSNTPAADAGGSGVSLEQAASPIAMNRPGSSVAPDGPWWQVQRPRR